MNLPWRQAIERGWFAKAGLRVEWRDEPGGTGALVAALNAGEIDAATILTEGAVAGIVAGGSFRLVALWLASPLEWGIHTRGGAARELREFTRPRYAVSRLGSGSHLMAFLLEASEGRRAEPDQFVVVGNLDGARAALRDRRADLFLLERYMTSPLVRAGEFNRIGSIPTPWPSFAAAAAQPSDPRVAPALRVALAQAHRMKPADISAAFGLTANEAKDWLATVTWGSDQPISPATIDAVQRALHDVGAIAATIPTSRIIAP